MVKRIAVLTGGGHISSFHAGMAGIVERANELGYEVIGIADGYKGLETQKHIPMISGNIEPKKAGSFLGSTRSKVDPEKAKKTFKDLKIDALIIMGGNDHMSEGSMLFQEGLNVVGWPKTMDNDLSVTYFTLGYVTAAENAARMVREGHYDAITNKRVHLITLFGRDTDWVVATAGAWGLADVVVPGEKYVPGEDEERYNVETIFNKVDTAFKENKKRFGRGFAVVAVAEGADIDGLESHVRSDEYDAHGNIKIEPIKLALVLKDAFRQENLGGKKYPIAINAASYELRNCAPVELDEKFAILAGRRCVDLIEQGDFGNSVVITEKEGVIDLDSAPLNEVSVQRFLRPMGFIDYENLKISERFIKHYQPVFGEPPKKEDIVYKSMI